MGVKLPLRGETGIEDAYEHSTEEKFGCNKTRYKRNYMTNSIVCAVQSVSIM
jgi:hypothetical protein